MTRDVPDETFAAAARDELARRVRTGARRPGASRPAASRAGAPSGAAVQRIAGRPPRRAALVQLAASMAVLLAIGGVVIAVQQVHPVAGGSGGTSPAPSLSMPPAALVPSASASPDPSPSATSTGPLVGPPGAKVRTEAEIRAWEAARGSSDITTEQAVITTRCMAEHGYRYDPVYESTADLTAAYHDGLPVDVDMAYLAAEYGPKTSAAYDWRTAGCAGLAVHQTGQDHAN